MEARNISSEKRCSIKEENPIKINLKNIHSTEELSEREKKIINKILQKYDFEIKNILKVKSVYKLETSLGNICLKRVKQIKHKYPKGSILIKELNDKGFFNTAKYFKDTNGNSYVKYKNSIFYAREWINGEECNLNNLEEAVEYMKLLAQYHAVVSNLDIKKLRIKNNLKNWPKIFSSRLQELEKFERMIVKKKIRNQFDTLYYNYIENSYHRGMVALSFLNTSDYYKLSKLANENRTICNDSFYHENIIKKDNNYYIIDLDNILVDLHINDLGKLIRRLMFKNIYQWDFQKAKLLIESYNSINKLNKNEMEVMLGLIVFPYKFWKLGKKRYLKHKGWDESKYMHKLNKTIKYNELQDKFLNDYLGYIENYS